jgi:hypothetical protein
MGTATATGSPSSTLRQFNVDQRNLAMPVMFSPDTKAAALPIVLLYSFYVPWFGCRRPGGMAAETDFSSRDLTHSRG